MSKYIYGATMDIGYQRESQEDFIRIEEFDNNLLCVIADGTTSMKGHLQPASIVVMHVIEFIKRMYDERKELLMQDPEYFLKQAMLSANTVLSAFKMGNEEIFSGYAASVTCAFVSEEGRIYAAHSGNTRLYLLRNGNLVQLTEDQTKAMELLENELIDLDTYHIHPDRLKLTSGIGVVLEPEIKTYKCLFKTDDIMVLTTDGVHYAIRKEAMAQIIIDSADSVTASQNLTTAARDVMKYPDNVCAAIIHYNHDKK